LLRLIRLGNLLLAVAINSHRKGPRHFTDITRRKFFPKIGRHLIFDAIAVEEGTRCFGFDRKVHILR
jgi:hypothetical protein